MKIYGFFNSLDAFGDAQAVAIDETGEVLAEHISSNESWAAFDLGMSGTSTCKHERYNAAHPGGWECEFVRISDHRDEHEGLRAAITARTAKCKTESSVTIKERLLAKTVDTVYGKGVWGLCVEAADYIATLESKLAAAEAERDRLLDPEA